MTVNAPEASIGWFRPLGCEQRGRCTKHELMIKSQGEVNVSHATPRWRKEYQSTQSPIIYWFFENFILYPSKWWYSFVRFTFLHRWLQYHVLWEKGSVCPGLLSPNYLEKRGWMPQRPSIANQSTNQQSHVHIPLRSIVQMRKGHGIRRGSGDSIKTGYAWAAQ